MVIVKDFYVYQKDEMLNEWSSKTSADFKRIVFSIFGILMLIFGTVNVAQNTEWFKIKIAPRVYLLEYATKALKK